MGTEDNGVFLFQAFDQITDLVDLFRIKADGWLIQNDNFRVAEHSLGDTYTLSVTFGKVFDQTVFMSVIFTMSMISSIMDAFYL